MVIHCLAADVRRFWPLIAAWVFVVAGAASIQGIRPLVAADPRLLNLIGVAGTLLWLAELLLLFALIALVVQAHPLVGSDAFWMTRPIPPSTLLISKLLLLGIAIVAAPAIAETVLMAFYHVPPREMAFVAVDIALIQAALLILLMTAAALTRSLPGFALLCGSAIGALAVVLTVATAIMMTKEDFGTARLVVSSSVGPIPPTGDPTGAYMWGVLAPAIGLAVLAVQYRTRSRLRASVLGVAGVLLVSAIVDVWPWPVLAPRVDVPDWARAASALQLHADAGTIESRREDEMFARRAPWRLVRARVRLTRIEPGWSAMVTLMDASIQPGDRSALPTARAGFAAAVPLDRDEDPPMRRVMTGVLGVGRLAEPFPPNGEPTVVFVVRETDDPASLPATGTYRGRFNVMLTRHEIEAMLPLRRGVIHQSGAYRLVVEAVDRMRGDGVTLIARESRAVSQIDRRPMSTYSYYLRNRADDSALIGHAVDMREIAFLSRFMPFTMESSAEMSGFMARRLMIRFLPTFGMQGESLPIDEAWIRGAELVIVRTTRDGSVQRELEIQDFAVRGRT